MKTTRTLGTLLLVLALVGCGGNAVAPDNNDNNQQQNDPTPLEWESIQRTPVSELLRSVDGFGSTQVAVGSGGTIVVREGNGDWQAIERPTHDVLRAVEMIDEKNGLIVGNGDILRTADAGRSWQSVAATNSFVDVSASGQSAIAVGINRMLVSSDAGKTWATPSGTFPVENFTRVAHHTDQVATATVSSSTQLFKTVDAGANWTEISPAGLPGVPREIAFFSLKLGIVAVSSTARIFWTDDGGSTWSKGADFGGTRIVGFETVDASTGFVMLSNGHIHKTVNAGESWTFESPVPLEFGDITAFDTSDPKKWAAVGELGFVSESPDAGNNWQQVSEGRIGIFHGVAFANANTGVAAFAPILVATETALRTIDGGASWSAVDPQIAQPFYAVMKPTGIGLLIGGFEVSQSVDGGASWSNISPPTSSGLLAGAVVDDLTYVVCGKNGVVFRTTNGGATWVDVSFDGISSARHGIDFFPGTETGVMVGLDESLRTTDGGVTWTEVDARGCGVACAGTDVVVAVHEDIMRSTDRGQTWSIVLAPALDLLAVAFADSKHGVAVGDCGTMFETLDGGATWSELTRTTSVQLRTVTFRDNESAVAAGRNGALLLGIE